MAGNSYLDLLVADDTDNPSSHSIIFLGSASQSFRPNTEVVVSFPGVYGRAWNFLTGESKEGKDLKTSCIFLPDKHSNGYGKHAIVGPAGTTCHCCDLYPGEGRKDHGCVWYTLWKRKTRLAQEAGCILIVVTKPDGSLGKSQQAEVSW